MKNLRVQLGLSLVAIGFSDLALADERQRLYRSAHYLGRGDTGIAVADDQEAIYYNPAGLAQGKGIYKRFIFASPQVEISKNSRDLYKQLEVEDQNQADTLRRQIGKPQHVGAYSLTALVFRRAAIGALISNQANVLVSKSVENGGLETVDADFTANQGLSFSLAERFWDWFHIGATWKYLQRSEAEFSANIIDAQNLSDLRTDELVGTGTGTGVDIGTMFMFANKRGTSHSLGITVANVGETKIDSADEGKEVNPVVQTLNAGYAIDLGTKFSRFKILADYRDALGEHEDNALKRIHLGTEISVRNFIGIMGGMNQGYPTAGMFLNFYLLRIDFATYTEEAGDRIGTHPDERYVLRLVVGI